MTVDLAPNNVKATERLYQTVATVLGVPVEEISDASAPATIPAWDSLNHLNLVMALESEFEISLTPEAALEMRDVGAMRTSLRRLGVDL